MLTPEQEKDPKHFHDESGTVELEVKNKELLIEWFAEHFKTFGTSLEFITNRSQEGTQFCKGFGGIGGILRWQVDFAEHEVAEDFEDDFF